MVVTVVSFGTAWSQEFHTPRIHRLAHEFLGHSSGEDEPAPGGKCGTHLVANLNERAQVLDAAAKTEVREMLSRPVLQTSRLTPSGRFRIHYDTLGFHQPAMIEGSSRISNSYSRYVDSVAAIFDHVWQTQVGIMGYQAPPTDKGKGGGPEYDVYVVSLGGGTFGVTYWSDDDALSTGTNQRFSTFMEIDNDYLFYRTPGLDGLRVTAAHEFHHAIQIGSYGLWTNVPQRDLYFYEMTSTWMEDLVYPDINDYLFDIPRYFRQFIGTANRSMPFFTYDAWLYPGYERSVYLHYLASRYGRDMVRTIWSEMARQPFKESLDLVLGRFGTRFGEDFSQFSFWNYYTADRASRDRYYPEGHLYPRMAQNMRATFDNFSTVISSQAYPVSSQLYEFVTQNDTLTAILVNVDLPGATSSPNTLLSFDLKLSNSGSQGGIQFLADGSKGALIAEDFAKWRVMYLSGSSHSDIKTQGIPYPNPVRPAIHPVLRLPLERLSSEPAEIVVLSSSLDRVFSGSYAVIESFGKPEIHFPINDVAGRIASGVHFIIVRVDQKEYRWKVAFIL